MKIGIDARFYGLQGLGRYTEQLILHLAAQDSQTTYIVFVQPSAQVPPLPSNFHVVRTTIHWYGWREQMLWPLLLYRYALDGMHFTHFNVPILYRRPFLVTIHDLILFHYPSATISTRNPFYFKLKYLLYTIVIKSAVRRAATIITVSDFSAGDIASFFSRESSKVIVIHEGFTASRQRVTVTQPAASPYLLYVGNAYPHKNLKFLVTNFAKYRMSHPTIRLVLVGTKDFFYRELEHYVNAEKILGVTFRGRVDDYVLFDLYAHAAAYIAPARYEGFGLPLLEAFAAQAPVLSSNRTSLPEVGGDAALYFDPENSADFLEKLDRILTDATLRRELVKKGSERILQFSWFEMTKKTRELYSRFKS